MAVKKTNMSAIFKCCRRPKEQELSTSDLIGRMISIAWTNKSYHDAFIADFDRDKGGFTIFYPNDQAQSSEILSEEDFSEIDWSLYPKVSRKKYTKYPPGTFLIVADEKEICYTGMVYDDAPKNEPGKLLVYLLEERRTLVVSKGKFDVIAKSLMIK